LNIPDTRYYGRDLVEGPAVRGLMKHSTELFSAMETILLETVTAKGWPDVKKAQMTECCCVTLEILQLFDGFFAEIQNDAVNNQPKNQG
jgi:hypothetical protein